MSFEEIFSFAADTDTDVPGIYAAGNPIGFTVLLKNDVCGYIYFLAIEAGDRAKGYGSAALRKMMVKYPNRQLKMYYVKGGLRLLCSVYTGAGALRHPSA